MKCACGDPACRGDVGFDSATGGLLIDMNRHSGIPGVGFIYLDVASATLLASQLKAYLLTRADAPSDVRTVVTPPEGSHP